MRLSGLMVRHINHAANIAMAVQTAAAKLTSKDTTAQPRIVTHIFGWLAANRQAPATNKTAPTTCTGHLRLYSLTLYPLSLRIKNHRGPPPLLPREMLRERRGRQWMADLATAAYHSQAVQAPDLG
jgi:hypothetical protein